MHGKTSHVLHDSRGIFTGLPQLLPSTRYHSLSASTASLPPSLAISATTKESGVIMGVRHREYTMEAVQYHPESILSESGDALLKNFLKMKGGTWAENPEFGVGQEKDQEEVHTNGVNGVAPSSAVAAAVGAGAASSKVPTIPWDDSLGSINPTLTFPRSATDLVPGRSHLSSPQTGVDGRDQACEPKQGPHRDAGKRSAASADIRTGWC